MIRVRTEETLMLVTQGRSFSCLVEIRGKILNRKELPAINEQGA